MISGLQSEGDTQVHRSLKKSRTESPRPARDSAGAEVGVRSSMERRRAARSPLRRPARTHLPWVIAKADRPSGHTTAQDAPSQAPVP